MGVSSSKTQNKLIQQSLNSVVQAANATCTPSCVQIQAGNTVIIENSTVGDISFIQSCTVDAQCQINQSLDAAATALQKAVQQGTAQPSWFAGLQFNDAKNVTTQEVRNEIEQSLNSTCSMNVNQAQLGNQVYAKNSKTGNIGFVQTADVHFNCVLDNTAKGVAASTQTADQIATAGGLYTGLIVIVLVIVLLIIVGIAAFLIITKRRQNRKLQKKQQFSTKGGQSTSDFIAAEQEAAASGVSTSDYLRAQAAAARAVPPSPSYLPPPSYATPGYPLAAMPPPTVSPAVGGGVDQGAGGSGGSFGSAFGNALGQSVGNAAQAVIDNPEFRKGAKRVGKKAGKAAIKQGKKYGGKAVEYGKKATSKETRAVAKSALKGGKGLAQSGGKAVAKASSKAGGKAASKAAGKGAATAGKVALKAISFIPK